MAKSTSNKLDKENFESTESVMINSHIRQFIKLKEMVKNSDKKVQYWTNQTSKLLESNCNIEMDYNRLMQKISDIDIKISENTSIHIMKKQELKDFQNARANISHKQWKNCLLEIDHYANSFPQWITEYSRQVLIQDIKNYHEECEQVNKQLTIFKQELNDMRKGCDSDCIENNVDNNDLMNLSIIMADIKQGSNNLMDAINSMEDTLHKIQNKIKQSKITINEYKIKEKPMF